MRDPWREDNTHHRHTIFLPGTKALILINFHNRHNNITNQAIQQSNYISPRLQGSPTSFYNILKIIVIDIDDRFAEELQRAENRAGLYQLYPVLPSQEEVRRTYSYKVDSFRQMAQL